MAAKPKASARRTVTKRFVVTAALKAVGDKARATIQGHLGTLAKDKAIKAATETRITKSNADIGSELSVVRAAYIEAAGGDKATVTLARAAFMTWAEAATGWNSANVYRAMQAADVLEAYPAAAKVIPSTIAVTRLSKLTKPQTTAVLAELRKGKSDGNDKDVQKAVAKATGSDTPDAIKRRTDARRKAAVTKITPELTKRLTPFLSDKGVCKSIVDAMAYGAEYADKSGFSASVIRKAAAPITK